MATTTHTLALSAIIGAHPVWGITDEAKANVLRPLVRNGLQVEVNEASLSAQVLASGRFPYYHTKTGIVQGTAPDADQRVVVGSIGVVPMRGALVQSCPSWVEAWCGLVSSDRVAADILRMAADDRIKQIVVPINSPGGQVAGVEGLHNAILEAKKKKPVIGVMESINASASLFATSACTNLFISGQMTAVGSLGVCMFLMDDTKAMATLGLEEVDLYPKESPRKNEAMRALFAKESDPTLAQNQLSEVRAALFAMATAARPGIAKDQGVKDGAVFTGSAAVTAGLADGISTLDAVITTALQDAQPTVTETTVTLDVPGTQAAAPANAGAPQAQATDPEATGTPASAGAQPATPGPQAAPTMNKFTALLATIATFGKELVGLDGPITAEQVTEANSALAREGVKGVALVDSASLKALREAQTKATADAAARTGASAKRIADIGALLKSHAQPELKAEATEEDAMAALMAHVNTLGGTAPAEAHTGSAAPAAAPTTAKYAGHDEALAQLDAVSTVATDSGSKH